MLIILAAFPSISTGAWGLGKAIDFDFFVVILDIVLAVTENMVLVGTVDWEDNIEVDSILFLLFIVDALVCDLKHGIFLNTIVQGLHRLQDPHVRRNRTIF